MVVEEQVGLACASVAGLADWLPRCRAVTVTPRRPGASQLSATETPAEREEEFWRMRSRTASCLLANMLLSAIVSGPSPTLGFLLARRHRGPRNKLLGCVSSFSLPLWRCFCCQGLADRLHDETEQGGGNDADSIGQCMHGGSCERREGRF